jgi:hypothetical protein
MQPMMLSARGWLVLLSTSYLPGIRDRKSQLELANAGILNLSNGVVVPLSCFRGTLRTCVWNGWTSRAQEAWTRRCFGAHTAAD